MDLETRQLAAFVGKVTLRVREILQRARVERFEILRGEPCAEAYPHWMALTEPVDCTSAALVEEELNRAFWFDSRHHHGQMARPIVGDHETRPQGVYLAWSGAEYPGSSQPRK
jgi:hypothetical protein